MKELKCLALSDPGAGEEGLSAVIIEQDLSRVPERLLILPRGELRWRKGDKEGTLLVDDEAMASVQQEFKARGIEMVVDYEHQTQNSQGNGRPAPAAGWIKQLVADGAGLWGLVKWTKEAAGYLADGAYKYTSPFLFWSEDQRVRRVATVALTNFPATVDANSIVLRYDPVTKDPEKEGNEMEFLQKMALMHGLPETATEAEVTAAIQAAAKKEPLKVEVVPPGVISALGLTGTATAAEAEAAVKRITDLGVEAVSRGEFDTLAKTLREERFTNQFAALKLSGLAMESDRPKFKEAWDSGEPHFNLAVDIVKTRPRINLTSRLTDSMVPTDTGKKLEGLALKAMESDKGLTYEAALLKVSTDNRELSAAYLGEQRGAQPRYSQSAG